MACIIWVLAALLCHAAAEFESQTCSVDRQATIQAGAEAMLGGIVAIQERGASGYGCGKPAGSMQWYEALRYSLDLLNKKDEYLNGQLLTDYYVPGVRLGMHVIDNCNNKDQAVAAVSTLFPSLSADDRSCATAQSNMTLGIVDSTDSATVASIAGFADNFKIPVVALSASAKGLTFSGMYPNFMRTVPPDNELVKVMGQVLTRLKWKYVVVIYENSLYGREAYSALRPVLAEAGICLTAAFMAESSDTSSTTMRNLLGQVVATDTVGTIFLGSDRLISALLKQGSSVNGAGKLQWIVTDSISLDSTFTYNYPRGILALVPASRYIVEFEDHWVRIDEENPSKENPWFRDWYMEKHQCNLAGVSTYPKQCSSLYQGMTAAEIERKKRLNFVQDQYVEPAVHAVFTYAYALREAQQALCPQKTGICSQLANLKYEDFLNTYLKNVDFTYAAQERVPSLASDQYAPYKAAKRLQFDARGDIINPSFSLWNYNDLPTGEENSTIFRFREVGNYINKRLTVNTDNIRMYTENRLTPLSPFPASPCPARGCSPCLGVPQEMKYYFQNGDIVINGIFSLHKMGQAKFTCGQLMSNTHPLYLEAMIYAVKKVNAQNILRGVNLGGLGIDDCMDSDLSSNFIMQVQRGLYTVQDGSGNALDPRKVEAYTGAYDDPLTIPLAGLMDHFMQPMVGYRATSAMLDKYKYYLKTVPGIEDEFRAIIMIMKSYNWEYTQILYSNDAYNNYDVMLFRRLATQAGICVVAYYKFDSDNRMAASMLSHHSTVRPVVLLLSENNHRALLDVLNSTKTRNKNDFIATSTFSNNDEITNDYKSVAEGFISIDITYSDLTQFYNELSTLRVNTYQRNPWFEEWFESAFNCYVGGNPRGYTSACNTAVGITSAPGFKRDLRVMHVINAVYAIARGLDSILTKYCGTGYNGVCGQFVTASRANKGNDLMEEILKVSFPIEDTNPSQTFRFYNRGGAYTYTVYSFSFGQFKKAGTVNPYSYSMSTLTTGLGSVSPPTCPKPCTECLYMFAFQQYWYLDGDLIIPAVFDVHYKGMSMYGCGPLRVNNGVQYTEAFKFALDLVNGGTLVNLNNVRLGGLAFDGCTSPARSLAIINGVMGRNFPIMDNQGGRVDISKFVSWLTYDSESTMEAADMLKMIGMPIVSPGATAPQLLDKTKYSTFFRTIPSDTVIARAMANLIQERGWKYVLTLNAPDAGNRKTRDLFRQYLKDMGICVIGNLEFETDGSVDVILTSIQTSTTHVVAVFADTDRYIPDMIRRLEAQNNPNNDIIFIANRYWNLDHMGIARTWPRASSVVTNTLSFWLEDSTVTDFMNYLNGLTLAGSDNPWLMEYYQAAFRCNFGGNTMYTTSCSSTSLNLGNSNRLYQNMYTLTTINAVHALALGLHQVLIDKCGAAYSGVCSRFLTDSDTLNLLMAKMDAETFTDVTSFLFDFIDREANRGFDIMQQDKEGNTRAVAKVSMDGNVTYLPNWDNSQYANVKSECSDDCLVCEGFDANFRNFSFIDGDVYIVGLFDIHTEGATPYTCGTINQYQGLELLEAFNFAIDYINKKKEIFDGKLTSVRIGGIGIDVCKSPTRAASLVANIHSGNIRLSLSGGFEIDPRQILAYVGPFDTDSTIQVADILNAIGVPQVTYGATGLQLQDPVKYHYLLRSVPADDKQARAIISYLKNFNLTNIQVVTSEETIGQAMTQEFLRLATLNLVCISHNYTIGEVFSQDMSTQAMNIVNEIVRYDQSRVVVLLVDDPLPILQAAGSNALARDNILWVATDKWGYDTEFLEKLGPLLGDRNSKKNVIIFDIETADVPPFDIYLQDKTPDNYVRNPWFREFYEDQFSCSWAGTGTICDKTRGLPRLDEYIQDPYVIYVVNAVISVGLGIDGALRVICSDANSLSIGGLCPKFRITGNRRDIVLAEMKKVNFTDDTLQPFYFESTGESSRGYHIYNVTANYDNILPGSYMYENVGSYNDTHFLKLDITYDLNYQAYCKPYDNCVCVNIFPEIIPSRYMLVPSQFELNLVYIGDIHQPDPRNPFACSTIRVGADFFKMMAFFYAIDRVNRNLDNRYPESLRLGGIALDTCSSTLRLEQDIFNLLSGYPLCDTGKSGQVVPPSSIIAFVPDGNANSIPVSQFLASTGITSVSPSATNPKLREFVMSEHFLSIVPPDDVQATVILKVMDYLNWNYASVVYTDEPSMVAAKNELLRQAAVGQAACVGQAVSLPLDADISDAESALEKVSQQVGARAVILFTLPAHTRLLLQASQNHGQAGDFIWIGTNAWGRNNEVIKGLEQQASGAIVLQPYSMLVEDFRTFVKSLTFTNHRGIPDDWFEEIYQTIHRCKIQDAKRSLPFSKLCSKTETITDDMVPFEPSVLHTIIAVNMVAQGLNQIPACQGSRFAISACITRLQNRNDDIYQAIQNAQWNVLPALLGDDSFTFSFIDSGYGNIGFDILNYHSSSTGSGYVYSRLGRYTDSLDLNSLGYQGLSSGDLSVPTSNCGGLECFCQGPTGIYGVPRQWTFIPGQTSIEVIEEGRTYRDPETGELFYVAKIPDVTTRFKDMWGVAMATLAALGVFVSLALFIYLLVVYPVRGGTSVLGYILSFSIVLLYSLVFAFVAHVNVELCGLRRFCLGFCYAISYSALFVKLVDCWRSREKEDMFEVKYSKLGRPLGLFMVTVLLVLVQVIISAEWLILEEPAVVRIFYHDQYWPRCVPNDFYDQGLVLSLCYIMVLILLTVLLGFCTFNSTKNHREARWILGIAILAVPTWVVWCAWATLGAIKTRDAAVAVGLLINATVLLLLGPVRKLYLLNKYQALIEEEERSNLQQERASKGNDYSTVYENQYDNAPQLHDRSSGIGSTRGGYRYPPSSVRSGR